MSDAFLHALERGDQQANPALLHRQQVMRFGVQQEEQAVQKSKRALEDLAQLIIIEILSFLLFCANVG